MEVPRLGVESELQLPVYTTATATLDLSRIIDLHDSSWQRRILNLLSDARDRTCVLMDTSLVHYCQITTGTATPQLLFCCCCYCLFAFSRAAPTAYGGSQARGRIRAVAVGLCQSHSNAGSEPCLQPTPRLTAVPDP